MEYKEIVKVIKEIFNKSFKTAFNIEYNSRKEITKNNTKFNIGEKAATFYDTETMKVYILSDVIEKIQSKNLNLNFDQGLTFLIHATFYELEHAIQKEHPEKLRNQFWYSKAMYDIESIILGLRGFDPQLFDLDYKKNHDNFLLETDADIKGYKKIMYSLKKLNKNKKTRYFKKPCFFKQKVVLLNSKK